MAALIAQITREHRERIARRKQTYQIKKSRYILPPFEDHFEPERDNKVQSPNLNVVRSRFFDAKFDGFCQFEQNLLGSRKLT